MANKPLTPLSARQVVMIVNNVRKVMLTGDTENLTKQAYDFLYQAPGFIAHYDLYGFRGYYENANKLADDIVANQNINQWRNFRPGERDYEYQMAKKECYNAICKMLEIEFGYKPVTKQYWW